MARGIAWFMVVMIAILSCSYPTAGDKSLEETQIALGVQQTLMAQSSELDTQATSQAEQVTLIAQAALGTQIAQQTAEIDQTSSQSQDSQSESNQTSSGSNLQQSVEEQSGVDFESFKDSASILLYEDMVGMPQVKRYVKSTLDMMGLEYKDDGSAKGWLKSDLLSGGPGGRGWDVVIIALELRSQVSGEYFEYLGQALNKGSSVILEMWHLDQIAGGKVGAILSKCGVEYYRNYVGKERRPQDIMVWSTGVDHPIMYDPNSGFRSGNVWEYWNYDDLGDLVRITGRGDAKLLMSTVAMNKSDHGVLTVCMDDRLIIQTFSSHSYPWEEMSYLWENYIENALKARYAFLQGQ
jgi:hypothetical protein